MSGVSFNRSLWRNRDFTLLWIGQTLSELGSQISLVAYPLLTLALTGSPAKAGIVGFARTLPISALALPAGALADHFDRRHVMIAADGIRAVALVALAVGLATGSVSFAVVAVVAFIDGAGFVTSYVAERGALTQLVPTTQLADAVARNESRTFAALVVGPTVGGLLFGIGRALPFVADAISYLASTTSALLIRSDLRPATTGEAERRVTEGVRWIWRHPFVRTCSILSAAGNPIFTGLSLLIVLLAHQNHSSSFLIGLMLAIAAAGGLVGALIAPRLQRRLSFRAALLAEETVLVVCLPLLLVAHAAVALGLIAACSEVLTPTVNAMVVSRRVAEAPPALQGRVQAASTLIAFSAAWLGPLAVGVLFQQTGSSTTILVLVGWAVALTAAAIGAPALRLTSATSPPSAAGNP